jgi:DNA-binding MarR family transcriptional regulator
VAGLEIAKPPSVLRVDVNGDGTFTISDAFLFVGDAFFLPGDWLIWTVATYAPPLARFFELGPSAYGGVLSSFVSAFAWLATLLLLIIVHGSIRDFDRALTSLIVRGYSELRRKFRIGVTLLGYRLRSLRKTSPKPTHVELAQEVDLSAGEAAVLLLYAKLQSGYALSVSEIADQLELRKNRAEEALGRLRKLGMLETTLGGSEGESAYRLTGAGRGLLVHHQLSRVSPEKPRAQVTDKIAAKAATRVPGAPTKSAQGRSSNNTTEAVSGVGPFKKSML